MAITTNTPNARHMKIKPGDNPFSIFVGFGEP